MGRGGKTKTVLKTLQKAHRRKVKRDADEKQVPTLQSFEIEGNELIDNLVIYVWDLLGDDTVKKTKILSLKDKRATKLISSIECPCCGKPILFNKLWNCYICQSDGKKIYEIIKVVKIYE